METKILETFLPNQERTLVKGKSGKYYVVSSVNLFVSHPGGNSETMIFSSSKEKQTNHNDLWMTRPRNHELGIKVAHEEKELDE